MTVVRFAAVDEVLGGGANELAGVEFTDVELARRDRLHFAADQEAFTAAHLLVRVCAGELLGLEPATIRLEQHCPRCGKAGHGRPSVAGEPELFVSLSHTRGYVAAVAAHEPCGIDVQTATTGVIDRAVTDRERAWLEAQPDPLSAFTRLWVRKESLVKVGLADEPGRLDVLGTDAAAREHEGFVFTDWTAPTQDGAPPPALGCVALSAG